MYLNTRCFVQNAFFRCNGKTLCLKSTCLSVGLSFYLPTHSRLIGFLQSFFEELLRNRETQLREYKQEVEDLKHHLNTAQQEAAQDRQQHQAIILELQQRA